MPSRSNSSPRRNSQTADSQNTDSKRAPKGAPARSNSSSRGDASAFPERTVDLSASHKKSTRKVNKAPKAAPPIVDAGVKRRALKKKRRRQSNLVAWSVAAAITVTLAGTAAGIWTEYQGAHERVAQKRATLSDLNAQLEAGKRRLSALASASGRERVLVENGFIKPGERLLLFPKTQSFETQTSETQSHKK